MTLQQSARVLRGRMMFLPVAAVSVVLAAAAASADDRPLRATAAEPVTSHEHQRQRHRADRGRFESPADDLRLRRHRFSDRHDDLDRRVQHHRHHQHHASPSQHLDFGFGHGRFGTQKPAVVFGGFIPHHSRLHPRIVLHPSQLYLPPYSAAPWYRDHGLSHNVWRPYVSVRSPRGPNYTVLNPEGFGRQSSYSRDFDADGLGLGQMDDTRAWELLSRGHDRHALRAFADARRHAGRDARPQLGYALTRALLGHGPEATDAMRRAIEMDPLAVDALVIDERLARRLHELVARWQQHLDVRIDQPDDYFMLAALYLLLDDFDAAAHHGLLGQAWGDESPAMQTLLELIAYRQQQREAEEGIAADERG